MEHDCIEAVKECGAGKFECPSNRSRCIWATWLCDNDPDCPDGEDELHCMSKYTLPSGEV